jgi:putative endonuclease
MYWKKEISMSEQRRELGRAGEEAAAQYLQQKGYQILKRNWRSRLGELDIIACKGKELVIVEVRTTSQKHYGFGFQSVDWRKQQKIRRLALQYIQLNGQAYQALRFDVISVFWQRETGSYQLDHIEYAF